jgi:ferritin-like metal-binding protein YciE
VIPILIALSVFDVKGIDGAFHEVLAMALQTLRALFIQQLRLIYSGEHQLSKSLPKILQGVSSQEVKALVRDYQLQVEERCERLEGISKVVTENLGGERCGVMEAFTRHAIALSELRGEDRVLDLAIMTTLRQVGHFEKSSYELARSFADVLGEDEVLATIDKMLSQTEENERALILLSEDMMDTTSHDRSTHEFGVFRVVPRDLAS